MPETVEGRGNKLKPSERVIGCGTGIPHGNPHREQDQANCDEEANHRRQHYEVCYLADAICLDNTPPSLNDTSADKATDQGVGRTRRQSKPPGYDVPRYSTGKDSK